jgi:hypothetical protein
VAGPIAQCLNHIDRQLVALQTFITRLEQITKWCSAFCLAGTTSWSPKRDRRGHKIEQIALGKGQDGLT